MILAILGNGFNLDSQSMEPWERPTQYLYNRFIHFSFLWFLLKPPKESFILHTLFTCHVCFQQLFLRNPSDLILASIFLASIFWKHSLLLCMAKVHSSNWGLQNDGIQDYKWMHWQNILSCYCCFKRLRNKCMWFIARLWTNNIKNNPRTSTACSLFAYRFLEFCTGTNRHKIVTHKQRPRKQLQNIDRVHILHFGSLTNDRLSATAENLPFCDVNSKGELISLNVFLQTLSNVQD